MTSHLAELVWTMRPMTLRHAHQQLVKEGWLPAVEPFGVVHARQQVKQAIEARSQGFDRWQVSLVVARKIAHRWFCRGVNQWYRDVAGCPVPWDGATKTCVARFVYKTSNSGKSLFGCASCDLTVSPHYPTKNCACGGRPARQAVEPLAYALFAGVQYAPSADGMIAPRADNAALFRLGGPAIQWCWCCGVFGPWTMIESVGRQRVCAACAVLVSSMSWTGNDEIEWVRKGRLPY